MINATVTGNIGKQPELKQTRNGKSMVNFSIASNMKSGNGEQTTTWIDCVAFESSADAIAGNIGKGMRVMASGRLQMEEYDKRDGSRGTSLRMVVNDIGVMVRTAAKQDAASDEPW